MNAPLRLPENAAARALDRIVDTLKASVPGTAQRRRDAVATFYANRPQYIAQLIYNGGGWDREPIVWPHPTKAATDMLQDVEGLLARQDAHIRNGNTVDGARRLRWLDAEAALLRFLLAPDEPKPGEDVYWCATCGARQTGDIPDCPRGTTRDCDVLCTTVKA